METYNKQTSPAAHAELQSKEELQRRECSFCYCEDKKQQDDRILGHRLSFQDRRISHAKLLKIDILLENVRAKMMEGILSESTLTDCRLNLAESCTIPTGEKQHLELLLLTE